MNKEEVKKDFREKLDRTKKLAEDGFDKSKEAAEKVKEVVVEGVEKTEEFVEKNPKKSAVIALGIGATIGAVVAKIFGRNKK